MRGVPRFVVCVLVAALAAVLLAGCASTSRIPAALVGRWKGGTHTNGPWFYEFDADGGYKAWPERSPQVVNEGTVFVVGSQITFSNGWAPVTERWSVSDTQLLLDGQRYRRA
jgi:hypothetical protein